MNEGCVAECKPMLPRSLTKRPGHYARASDVTEGLMVSEPVGPMPDSGSRHALEPSGRRLGKPAALTGPPCSRDRVEVGPVPLAVDKTPGQTVSQLRMTGYLHTDERHDVLASLEHCALCLASAERSSGAWKWVVLSLHSALQGAMICHLSGTAGVGALTSTCARQWSQWHERDGRGEIDYIDEGVDELGLPARGFRNPDDRPPSDRVASAPELFKRLGSESERIESGCGRIISR